MRAVALVVLVACGSKREPPPPPPTPGTIDREALLAGKLPEGTPETDLINAQCRICHSVDYLTQQRLSEAGWKKAIDKMRAFGASLSDADAASLTTFAARHWNAELPDRTYAPVAPPAGALPAGALP